MAAAAQVQGRDLHATSLPTSQAPSTTTMENAGLRAIALHHNKTGSLSTLDDTPASGSANTSTTKLSQADSVIQSSASSRSSYDVTEGTGGEAHKSSSSLVGPSTPRASGLIPGQPGVPTPAPSPSAPAPPPTRSLGGWLSRLQGRSGNPAQIQNVGTGQLSEADQRKFTEEALPRFKVLMRTIVRGSRYEYGDELAYNFEKRKRPTVVISYREANRGREIDRALKTPQFSRYLQALGWDAVTKHDSSVGYKGRSRDRIKRGLKTEIPSPPKPDIIVDICISPTATTTTGALLMFTRADADPISLVYQEGVPNASTCGGLVLVNGIPMALTTKHASERLTPFISSKYKSASKPSADPEWPSVDFGTVGPHGKAYGFHGREFLADWLVINVNETLLLPNQVSMAWSRQEIKTLTRPLNCVIHTSRWPVYGVFDGTQALFTAGMVSSLQYVVHLAEELLPGDSGSWVCADGKLVGMVIAASSDPFQAYIEAIEDVFDDISRTIHGFTVSLPSDVDNDLLRMRRQASQGPARSLNVRGFTLQQLPDAIMRTMKSKTRFLVENKTAVFPLLEDTRRIDSSLGFVVGEDLPRYDVLTTNPVPIRALIWLGMQLPVSSRLRVGLVPKPKELPEIPSELFQSAAGESLMVFIHALRGLVSLKDLPAFISSLFYKFEIPLDEVPGMQFLTTLTAACESIHDSMNQVDVVVNDPVRETRISNDDHTDFAVFLGAIPKVKPNNPRDIVLCMGPWGDWVDAFCQVYLELPVWRWQSDDELSKGVIEWLEEDPPRWYPQIWIVDRPGPFRCRLVRNDALHDMCTDLIDQYYLLIKDDTASTAAEAIELEPLASDLEKENARGPAKSKFNTQTAWLLPLFAKRAAKTWKQRTTSDKLNMKTSTFLFRAANRWMLAALKRGISAAAMGKMYRNAGYSIPRSMGRVSESKLGVGLDDKKLLTSKGSKKELTYLREPRRRSRKPRRERPPGSDGLVEVGRGRSTSDSSEAAHRRPIIVKERRGRYYEDSPSRRDRSRSLRRESSWDRSRKMDDEEYLSARDKKLEAERGRRSAAEEIVRSFSA